MNKKLLILVGKKGRRGELFTHLVSERMGEGAEVLLATFSDLFIEVDKDETKVLVGGVDIKEFDLVYIRRIDHSLFPLSGSLAMCLDKLGIKYFDTRFREIGAGGDKFTSVVKLALSGICVPKTIFCARDKIVDEKERIASSLGFPMIAKDTQSQGNSGIFLLKNEEDFGKLLELREERLGGSRVQFLFQKFLDMEQEFRLLVLGDRVAIAHKKDKRNYNNLVVTYDIPDLETEFVEVEEISDSLKAIAVKAAKALNVEIAGVDICVEKKTGRELIIEVNRGPGFEYDETKSSEIHKVAGFLKENLGKK